MFTIVMRCARHWYNQCVIDRKSLCCAIVGSYKIPLSVVQGAALVRAGTIRQLCHG